MRSRIAKIIWIFQVLIVSSGIVTPAWSAEQAITVALLINADSRIHDKTVTGIKQVIDEHGLKQLNYQVIDINNPHSAEEIKAKDIDYAIVVGVKPALFALKHEPAYPVLYTLIPESTYKKITSGASQTGSDDYVIFLGQKPSRQLALVQAITGNKSRVGFVVGEQSRYEADKLEKASAGKDLQLIVKQSASEDTVIDDIKQVLMESDVYLALYDSNILNRHNAKWLLYMAYKMNKPVIGFSSSYTRAGALASIFSTPEQIGKQSGEWLIAMLNGHKLPRQQYPGYYSITTNPSIQRALRLARTTGDEIKSIIQRNEEVKIDVQD